MAKLTADTYSDQELLDLYRQGIAEGSAGQTRTVRGKTITYPSLREMWALVKELEMRIAATSGRIGIVSVSHGRRI